VKIGAQKLGDEVDVLERGDEDVAKTDDILMPQVLQQLQFTVGTLGQDRCAERLHDLLDSNGLVCELILCRTDKTKSSHSNGGQFRITAGDLEGGSEDLRAHEFCHLDGIDGGSGSVVFWLKGRKSRKRIDVMDRGAWGSRTNQ